MTKDQLQMSHDFLEIAAGMIAGVAEQLQKDGKNVTELNGAVYVVRQRANVLKNQTHEADDASDKN